MTPYNVNRICNSAGAVIWKITLRLEQTLYKIGNAVSRKKGLLPHPRKWEVGTAPAVSALLVIWLVL